MMDGLELQMLLKLGLVLLLIFPALWVLRRLVGAPAAIGRGKVIHVLEIQPLPEGQRLYLVRVQGRHLLLGGCKESLGLLAELEALDEPAATEAPSPMGWDQAARTLAAMGGRQLARLSDRLRIGRPEAL